MTPTEMARIHAASFPPDEAWSTKAFAETLGAPHTEAFSAPGGFALTRTLAGESELLTLAIAPCARRRGLARGLLVRWIDSLRGRSQQAFLEVAADNTAAIALYESLLFQYTGRRRGYYASRAGGPVDALLMARAVTHGHAGPGKPIFPETG